MLRRSFFSLAALPFLPGFLKPKTTTLVVLVPQETYDIGDGRDMETIVRSDPTKSVRVEYNKVMEKQIPLDDWCNEAHEVCRKLYSAVPCHDGYVEERAIPTTEESNRILDIVLSGANDVPRPKNGRYVYEILDSNHRMTAKQRIAFRMAMAKGQKLRSPRVTLAARIVIDLPRSHFCEKCETPKTMTGGCRCSRELGLGCLAGPPSS